MRVEEEAAVAAEVEHIKSRMRTASDYMSGLDLSNCFERYPNFPAEELQKHFQMFKSFDIDDSGFITPENLFDVVQAMGIDLSKEQMISMIQEVAVLSGHENDGKLSFRDFIACIQYEKTVSAHNTEIEAEEELASLRLEEDEDLPASADDSPDSGGGAAKGGACGRTSTASRASATSLTDEELMAKRRMRRSSFSVMNSIAKSRIHTFQQAVEKAVDEKDKPLPSKFMNRLEKFKKIEAGEQATLNNERLQTAALTTKLAAFEQASKKDPVTFKKSWRNVKHGAWQQKTSLGLPVAQKVSLAERLAADAAK